MKKKLNIKIIRNLKPCYDPSKYLDEKWSGTVIDILKMKQVPAKDRLWVVVREDFLSSMEIKLYGLKCAEMVKNNTNDKRVHDCLKTVKKYLNGKATTEDLSAARSAAAESAAWSAAAARSAAAAAAESAAWSAAAAAESAAWSAAAARSAAWSAAESAAESAAAESAARSAMEEKQCKLLINILKRSRAKK